MEYILYNVHCYYSWSFQQSVINMEDLCCYLLLFSKLLLSENSIDGVMVSVLSSSAVDHGFEPWSSQTEDYKIGICCFSTKHAALRRKSRLSGSASG
jgi:hypothetical protein